MKKKKINTKMTEEEEEEEDDEDDEEEEDDDDDYDDDDDDKAAVAQIFFITLETKAPGPGASESPPGPDSRTRRHPPTPVGAPVGYMCEHKPSARLTLLKKCANILTNSAACAGHTSPLILTSSDACTATCAAFVRCSCDGSPPPLRLVDSKNGSAG